MAGVLFYVLWLNRRAEEKFETLMLRTFPEKIAYRLMESPETTIADSFASATVLFADLAGFVPLSRGLGAPRTVAMLNDLVQGFDRLAAQHGVERVKTIGDAYMAVAGVPDPTSDHAARIGRFALSMQKAVASTNVKFGVELTLRIGIASGP